MRVPKFLSDIASSLHWLFLSRMGPAEPGPAPAARERPNFAKDPIPPACLGERQLPLFELGDDGFAEALAQQAAEAELEAGHDPLPEAERRAYEAEGAPFDEPVDPRPAPARKRKAKRAGKSKRKPRLPWRERL